jgi:hypothetical protein
LSFFSSLSCAFAWGYQASNRWMEPEGIKAFWFWEWCHMGLGHISFCLQHHFTTLHCTWQIDWQICLSSSYWWMFVLRHAGEDGFAHTSIAQMGLQRRCTLSTHWWVASKLFHGISNPLGGFDLQTQCSTLARNHTENNNTQMLKHLRARASWNRTTKCT